MSMKEKIKNLFTEDDSDESTEALRARYAKIHPSKTESPADPTPQRRIKSWVKSWLGSSPWLIGAIIAFGWFSQGAIASAALGYGLMKVAIAVLLTLIADETMFRGQKDPYKSAPWVPMIRRSTVFVGICWLMAVT